MTQLLQTVQISLNEIDNTNEKLHFSGIILTSGAPGLTEAAICADDLPLLSILDGTEEGQLGVGMGVAIGPGGPGGADGLAELPSMWG